MSARAARPRPRAAAAAAAAAARARGPAVARGARARARAQGRPLTAELAQGLVGEDGSVVGMGTFSANQLGLFPSLFGLQFQGWAPPEPPPHPGISPSERLHGKVIRGAVTTLTALLVLFFLIA